jgi:hypothetical protein
MHDSERYRRNAGDCLNAAHKSSEPRYQRLHRLMAQSWLTLARQDEATDELLASWAIESIQADGNVVPFPMPPMSAIGQSGSVTLASGTTG